MPAFLRLTWLLALLLVLGQAPAAHASHMRGQDISFASIASTTAGVPRYHVVVRIVYIPGITWVVNNVTLTASRGNPCNTTAPNAFTATFSSSRMETGPAQFCTAGSPNTSLYDIYYYEGDIDLPADQWWLSVAHATRPTDVQNIPNSGVQPFYLSAYVDSRTLLPDASPKFASALQPVINAAALSPFSFSAFDADGDSLVYELIQPYANCSQSIPGTLPPHFGLNASTGAFMPVTTSASTQGYYNVTVKVTEYRRINSRWAAIGYVVRDSLYLLYASANQPPTFTTMQVNGGPAQPLGPVIAAQPGQLMTVTLQATDPDVNQTIRFALDVPGTVPGLSLTRIGTTNGALLTWQVPAALPPGRYSIPVAVLDDGCAYSASEQRTLVFVVGNAALAARPSLNALAEVYPVPFREQVQFTAAPHQAVVLFDALGREVARLTAAADGRVRWQPAPTLPAGLYVARSADGRPLARLLRAE